MTKDKTKPKFQPKDSSKKGLLDRYFRDMSMLSVLEPKQEFEYARRIEEADKSVWTSLFAYPPVTPLLVDQLLTVFDEPPRKELLAVRRVANEVRKASSAKSRQRLAKHANTAADAIMAIDQDRKAMLTAIDFVTALSEGRAKDMGLRIYFDPTGRPFQGYLAEVNTHLADGERIRSTFVRANLRLVVSIARRYNHGRMPLVDLIQEGNLGLIKAVDRFDPHKGFRFSTYASWWIRHAISRAIADKGRTVRLPVHVLDAQQRLAKAERNLSGRLGRDPSDEEIAEEMAITEEKLDQLRQVCTDQHVSLDSSIGDAEGRKFSEQIEDPETGRVVIEEGLSLRALVEHMRSALTRLKPIEADIIRHRFGLDGGDEETLKQIGERYNLSRERIRQLQEQALTKMRRALHNYAA